MAKTYRWTDAQGRIHYSDRVPPEQVERARTRLNKSGLEVEQVKAARTPEEIERERQLERLRAEEQRLIEEQRKRDRVLLRTFRSEDDILMIRDGKLASIDASIQIVRSNIKRLKLQLAEMQRNAANLERQGKKISKNYLKAIDNTRLQLKRSYESIISKEQAKASIEEKYAADLDRFRQLKHLNAEAPKPAPKQSHTMLETVVTCSDKKQCDTAWKQAEAYLRKHATTRLQMLARNIIMTAAPLKDDDISITISRIRKKEGSGADLFMDLQCKNSPRGRELCDSKQVERIRSGFRAFLQQ